MDGQLLPIAPGPGAVVLPFPMNRVAVVECRRHRFRWAREDAFSASSLYACRCGVVRPAL